MATRTVQLRAADARDIDAVDTVMATAFDPRWGEAWTRSQTLGVLAMPGVRLTLALVDDGPAGFALSALSWTRRSCCCSRSTPRSAAAASAARCSER